MDYIKNNLSFLKEKYSCIAGAAFGVLSIFLSFVSWEDMGITSKCHKLLILAAVVLASFLLSVGWLCLKRNNKLWEEGEKRIQATYGDLLRISKKNKFEKIVVIPVNTTFDTIVGDGIVAPGSVHGRWIKSFCSDGHTVAELDTMIEDYFAARRITPCSVQDKSEKPKGKCNMYPRGTVAVINDGQTHYYLLALGHFDKNLNAHCSKEDLLGVITKMIDFYDKNGQGLPIYIPLMGSGMSRTNVTPEESLQIITDLLKLNRQKIHGEANVVVYSKMKNQISIFDL